MDAASAGGPGCGTVALPCKTIQSGVDAAAQYDTVDVAAGTYPEGDVAVNVNTPNLRIQGAQAGVDARTRTVPVAQESVITSNTGSFFINADNTVIDGFTTQGQTNVNFAGMRFAASKSGHRILNNIVKNNMIGAYPSTSGASETVLRHNFFDANNNPGPSGGTAIYVDNGSKSLTIDENRFRNNQTASLNVFGGPDSYCPSCGPADNVAVTGNTVESGGGVLMIDVTDATLAANTISAAGSGIFIDGSNGVDVRGNTLAGGAARGVRINNVFTGIPSRHVRITGNTITGNALDGISIANAGAVPSYSTEASDSLEVHDNRIVANAGDGIGIEAGSPTGIKVNASDNYWGCNTGANTAGCETTSPGPGTITTTPFLRLVETASPTSIAAGGRSSTISAALRRNTDNAVSTAFPSTPIAFTATLGSLSFASVNTVNGAATNTLTSGDTSGTATVTATLDNGQAAAPVTITALPAGPPGAAGTPGTAGAPGAPGANGAPGASTPLAEGAPVVRLVTKTARLSRKNTFGLLIGCSGGPRTAVCNGTAKVRSITKIGGKRITFGTRPFQTPSNAKRSIKFSLSRRAAGLVRKQGSVRANVFIVLRDSQGNSTGITAVFTLRG